MVRAFAGDSTITNLCATDRRFLHLGGGTTWRAGRWTGLSCPDRGLTADHGSARVSSPVLAGARSAGHGTRERPPTAVWVRSRSSSPSGTYADAEPERLVVAGSTTVIDHPVARDAAGRRRPRTSLVMP